MSFIDAYPALRADARSLVEETLRTGLILADLIADLLEDMPDDTRAGDLEALLDMLAGTAIPAVHAAGPDAARRTVALLGAVRDRVCADLRGAAAIAERREMRCGHIREL
jgi:hypothetical protein